MKWGVAVINHCIGDYRLTNYLGRGCLSEVYRAICVSTPDVRLAVKVIEETTSNHQAFRMSIRELFERLQRLNHQNTIRYYDLLFDESRCFLVMEYVNGHPLSTLVQPNGITAITHALGLLKRVLEAVAEAHTQGLVHGHLTAWDVLYGIDKRLKVCDFGLRHTLWQLGIAPNRGELASIPPELLDDRAPVNELTDIYSLGVLLFHLLTGRLPEPSSPTSPSQPVVDQLHDQRPDLPERILELVAQATALDPSNRFPSVMEMLNAVVDEPGGGDPRVSSGTPPSHIPIVPMRNSDEALINGIEPDMVYIPAGPVWLGSDRNLNEQPIQEINLPAFEIAKYPITNHQFRIFCDQTGRPYPPDPEGWANYFLGYPDHPVIRVNWFEAECYCQWLSRVTGKPYRLPTEVEWEKAARGGLQGKAHPWGDEEPHGHAHFGERVYAWEPNMRGIQTKRVGSYPPNGYGLYDMAGNVWEWCADWYAPYVSGERQRRGIYKVARGGSWASDADALRCAYRMNFSPSYRDYYIGFRVAKSP